jgi:two-component system sensor histidine kinase UhpB
MSAIDVHHVQEWQGSGPAGGEAGGNSDVLRRFMRAVWRGRSVRWQVLATFLLINVGAAGSIAALAVLNASRATETEIAASVAMAERFVRASVEDLARSVSGDLFLGDLPGHLGPLRHVRLVISTASGRPVWLARSADGQRGHSAPAWFAAMIEVNDLSREVPVISAGRRIGSVFVIGDPGDEIAEVWADLSDLAVVGAMVNLVVILVLYFAFGRVLTPLSALAGGLLQLEHGRFDHRLNQPKARELADLARRFNALAGSLSLSRADNIRLHHHLMTAQEDERQHIARELHDELGPCLFGLKANLASLDRLAVDMPAEKAGSMRERTQQLIQIACRIQTVNRRLLQRLRPMALGEIPLQDLLATQISEFAQHEDAPQLKFNALQLAQSYGDCLDLTIYRCLQEGLTNAVRHSHAKTVEIRVEELRCGEGGTSRLLRLVLQDDGRGMPAEAPLGLGLTGMRERVRALGGAFAISAPPGGGTRLDIQIPADVAEGSSAEPRAT